jgi:hypothetical protein
VFLEGVASRSPHGSAMCDKSFTTMVVLYHWRRLVSLDNSCVLLWKDTSLAKRKC